MYLEYDAKKSADLRVHFELLDSRQGGQEITDRSLSGSVSIMSVNRGKLYFFRFIDVRWPPFPCLSGKSSELNRGETTLAVIKSR